LKLRQIENRASGAAGEIEQARRLLDDGAIIQAEFDALKAGGLFS
jgi:hypothetical protein